MLADVPLEDIVEEGLRRLSSKETWKVWQFDGQEFYDAETFRNYVHEHHIKEELLRLLPKDDPKGTERPAEAALRQRMTDLLTQVQVNNRQVQDEQQGPGVQQGGGSGGRGRRAPRSNPEQTAGLIRVGNVEMISTMLEALEKEHEQLYQSLLKPITTFVIDLLPVSGHRTRGCSCLLGSRLATCMAASCSRPWEHSWLPLHQTLLSALVFSLTSVTTPCPVLGAVAACCCIAALPCVCLQHLVDFTVLWHVAMLL